LNTEFDTKGRKSIKGVQMELIDSKGSSYILVHSQTLLRTLNSSPWSGGFGYCTQLVNRQVDPNYQEEDPIEEMNHFLREERLLPEKTAGMLTAARVVDYGSYALAWNQADRTLEDGLQVQAYATVGLSNKARAGRELLEEASLFPGTINIIVIVNGKLTDAAMVNAVITATEAKTAALVDLGVDIDESGSKKPATGTTTDAVLIAATERGDFHRYAGTATQLGYLIGRVVYESVLTSGKVYINRPY
jgi:adenosylcobinamide hydrolase